MTNHDLITRIRAVLRELTLLQEAGAQRLDSDGGGGGKAGSAPPPGVRFGRRDWRDVSLATYWHERFKSARGKPYTLRTLLFLAERDLLRATHRTPMRDPHETDANLYQRIVRDYEGLDPLEVGLIEDLGAGAVRLARRLAGRDEESGYALESDPFARLAQLRPDLAD